MKKTRLCSICARGGSKGFKNKNIQDFFGVPLISHLIRIAKVSNFFDAIAVSSDSDEILEIASATGADYIIKRPEELASDSAAKIPAIQHCAREVERLSKCEFDTFVDLSVTSPLMLPDDIQGAVSLLEKNEAINVITGSLSKNSPYFSMVEMNKDQYVVLSKSGHSQIVRRQDCPKSYDMNGAIYVWLREHFFNIKEVITSQTLIYEMPSERSIDIDNEIDYQIAKFVYSLRNVSAQISKDECHAEY